MSLREPPPDQAASAKPRARVDESGASAASVPVITIDGPTASGKGTLALGVAQALGWRVLDSGALYRLTALACLRAGVDAACEAEVAAVASTLDVRFDRAIWLASQDVTDAIRAETVGNLASQIAAFPAVRQALLDRQRAFREAPGLVADGRDMGTVVFPDAVLKVFLVASAEARAQRRYKQLISKGISANITDLLRDLQARDARDAQRAVSPLVPAPGARRLDSSNLTIAQTIEQVLDWYREAD